jgi:transposase-like protein
MSLLSKIFGRDKAVAEPIEVPPCPHTAVVPRWADAADMGKQDRVSSYYCQACGQTFTPEEMKAATS